MEEFDFGDGGGLQPSPQPELDKGQPQVPAEAKDSTISDLLLGVVNWWCLKFGTSEVVNLVMRHFEHGEVYKSCLYLAESCGLPIPGNQG